MQDKKIIKLMDIKRETVYLASLLRGAGKLLFYLKGESRTMSMGNGTYAARSTSGCFLMSWCDTSPGRYVC